MHIFAFTDLHSPPKVTKGQIYESITKQKLEKIRKKIKKENPDIIINCGDFTMFGNGLEKMLKFFNSLGKPFYFTHGNHEEEREVRKLAKKYKYLHFFHKETCVIDGMLFLWYGGGGFAVKDKPFERFAKTFEKNMKDYDNVVMITHAPPRHTRLDPILGEPCGNASFKAFIEKHKRKLKLYLCGHLHENSHEEDRIGDCLLLNPGSDGEFIHI